MTITLQNINKSYKKKQVLSNINLIIPDNTFTVLNGVSGSGKSTLLNIIGGLEPATSGQVIIDDQNISNLKGKARADFYRHKIGFIFQGFYLQPQLTIAENIALMGTFAGMPKSDRQKRARELAEKLNIVDTLDRLPSEVSGGQAERACIARALFMNPGIILADEPTNNLDPKNAENVISLLKQLQQDTDTTMIVASHDPLVNNFATQIIHLENGHISTEDNNHISAEEDNQATDEEPVQSAGANA